MACYSRRSFPAVMLNHHSPPVGRAISVCRCKRRGSRFAVGFPARAVRLAKAHGIEPRTVGFGIQLANLGTLASVLSCGG